MNGPLLIGLLPPERLWDAEACASVPEPFVAILLLAGLILSLLLRRPNR